MYDTRDNSCILRAIMIDPQRLIKKVDKLAWILIPERKFAQLIPWPKTIAKAVNIFISEMYYMYIRVYPLSHDMRS